MAVAAVSVKLQALMILLRDIRRLCGEQNLLEQNRRSPEESSCSGIRATVASVRKTGNLSTVAVVSHPNCQKPQEHTQRLFVYMCSETSSELHHIYTDIFIYIHIYIQYIHKYTYIHHIHITGLFSDNTLINSCKY